MVEVPPKLIAVMSNDSGDRHVAAIIAKAEVIVIAKKYSPNCATKCYMYNR